MPSSWRALTFNIIRRISLICETTKYELIYKLIYCGFYIYVFMNKCLYIYMYIDF